MWSLSSHQSPTAWWSSTGGLGPASWPEGSPASLPSLHPGPGHIQLKAWVLSLTLPWLGFLWNESLVPFWETV